jgi:hypothetical protein
MLSREPRRQSELALFSAALVLALGMIIAGTARRRSGFLAFVTVATLAAGRIAGGAGTLDDVRFGDVYASNTTDFSTLRQPFGSTGIVLANMEGVDSHPVTVHKGSGYTEVYVSEGVELQLTAAVSDDVTVQWSKTEYAAQGDVDDSADGSFTGVRLTDGRTLYRETLRSTFDPLAAPDDAARGVITVHVTITQDSGQINVIYSTRPDKEAAK